MTENRTDKRAESLVQPQRPAELHGCSETIQQHQSMSVVAQRTPHTICLGHHAASEARAGFHPPLLATLLSHQLPV